MEYIDEIEDNLPDGIEDLGLPSFLLRSGRAIPPPPSLDKLLNRPSPFQYSTPGKSTRVVNHITVAQPARHQNINTNSECVSVLEVRPPFRDIFPYEQFNEVQSRCFNEVYHSDVNMIVSAPTGSGKTLIMELAIVRLVQEYMQGNTSHRTRSKKVIYMAPIKALCQQIISQWSEKFGALGIKCAELTGDSEDLNAAGLSSVDVIITTPEKWDAMTRKWKEHKAIMNEIALFLIDEVHLLNEDRGAILEAVVSRMNTMRADTDSTPLRFIALSATIPNIEDIADWLQVPPIGIKRFSSEYRPVPIDLKVMGFQQSKNDFLFDRNLNYKLYDLIRTHGSDKPALIFCATRKSAIQAAVQVSKDCGVAFANPFIKDREQRQSLFVASQKANDKALAELIKAGIGYHTAGMSLSDRGLVEGLFLDGELRVVCATTSLSQGVNFPAHLVIIKGTSYYKTGIGYCEHNALTVNQMIGRAGRPQFDNSAVAIVMTADKERLKWENLLSGKQAIESNLLAHLTEHLNSEIVLRTITDVSVAVTWLKGTYLYKRIIRNPTHYNIPKGLSEAQLNSKLKDILGNALNGLESYGMIEKNDTSISPLGMSKAHRSVIPGCSPIFELNKSRKTNRLHLNLKVMKAMTRIEPTASLSGLIEVLASAKEFSHLNLRVSEKRKLNEMNDDKERMRFTQKGKIKTGAMKVNCLIQAILGNIPIDDWSLKQEAQTIFSNANRLSRGMIQCLAVRKHFTSLRSAIILGKCLSQKMWENSPYILKQLDKIGQVFTSHLISGGISSFEDLAKADPRRIESLVGRHPPFGSEVKDNLGKLPKFDVQVQQNQKVVRNGAELLISCQSLCSPKVSPFNTTYLIAGDADNNLLCFKKFRTATTPNCSEKFVAQNPKNSSKQVTVALLNEEFIGLDVIKVFVPKFDTSQENHSNSNPVNHKPITTHPVTFPEIDDDDDSWLFTPITEIARSSAAKPTTPVIDLVKVKDVASTQICKHTCKDKSSCKHECCKIGLKTPRREKRTNENKDKGPQQQPDPIILKSKPHNEVAAKRLKTSSQTILTSYFPVEPDEQVVPGDMPPENDPFDFFIPTTEPTPILPFPGHTPQNVETTVESYDQQKIETSGGKKIFSFVQPTPNWQNQSRPDWQNRSANTNNYGTHMTPTTCQ